MEYIMMGFLFAIGWTWGKAVSGAIAKALLNWMEHSDWYQGTLVVKPEYVEETSDIKVVKNQIGFR